MKKSRREFVRKVSASLPGIALISNLPQDFPLVHKDEDVTTDEEFWYLIKQHYTVSASLINLNNGGVSPQPKVVQEAVERYNQLSNETPSYYMWRIVDQGKEPIREKLALLGGVDPNEIAINRNSSEALETVIFGLPLNRGDEVILTKQDYPNMVNAWKQREHRDGIVLKWLNFEFPIEEKELIVSKFVEAFTERTKLVHITHLINWNGQVLPAGDIAKKAREAGIEVLIDAAHSFAHLPYQINDLHCDYFGTSLHKWLCAPFGTGMLYVRKSKIGKIYPLLAAPDPTSDDIRKFEHLGTRSMAIEQGIGQAVDFHELIGSQRKYDRLHYLQNYWINRVRDIPKVKIGSPTSEEFSGALGIFSIDGMKPGEITNRLFREYKIHTTGINWENISGVRVTPNVYTVTKELDKLVRAIQDLAKTT